MSEQRISPETAHTRPPINIDQLPPPNPAQALYDIYTERIADLPGFRQRPYHEAESDFKKSIVDADDEADIAYVPELLHRLVTPEAYDALQEDLTNFWLHYGLEGDLDGYSYCFLTNHRVFSDLPIIAGEVRDMRRADPYSASRNHMIVGKLIPGMEVDMFGDGSYVPVTGLLKMVARQIQSVPKLPDDANDSMKAQRRIWNEESKYIMRESIENPGNILYVAASGSQDIVSKDGKLTMQSVNPETAAMLCSPRLKVIPLFFSCKSFDEKGLVAAEPDYTLLKPRIIKSTDEVFDLMDEFGEIGSELLKREFPRGVHYDKTLSEKLKHMAAEILHFSSK